jgi:septal ring factor EnvC (AmiA/AmiB activator)
VNAAAHRYATLLVLLLALAPAVAAAATTATQAQNELQELRGRISALQKKLAAAEETKSEASDALRESEQAISEANRELRELTRQARDSGAKLGTLRKSSQDTGTRLHAQQELLGRMLRRQYLQGEPDALRLVLARENPNDMARQLHYLAHIARARARLVDGLRSNLAELDRLTREIAEEAEAIARIARDQAEQKKRLEREKRARAEVLTKVSRDIRTQQQQIRVMQNNENRLTRLIDQLARLVQQPQRPQKPAAGGKPRPRNDKHRQRRLRHTPRHACPAGARGTWRPLWQSTFRRRNYLERSIHRRQERRGCQSRRRRPRGLRGLAARFRQPADHRSRRQLHDLVCQRGSVVQTGRRNDPRRRHHRHRGQQRRQCGIGAIL